MGFVDHIVDICDDAITVSKKTKRKPMQTVEIKVKMDCDGCERRVKNAASSMKGARSVEVNRKQSYVSVRGYVEPKKVLEKVMSTGKKAEFWPYVEYNLTSYPYARGAYDKKAPSGYVRDVDQAFASPNEPIEKYTTVFSDDNVNACSVM